MNSPNQLTKYTTCPSKNSSITINLVKYDNFSNNWIRPYLKLGFTKNFGGKSILLMLPWNAFGCSIIFSSAAKKKKIFFSIQPNHFVKTVMLQKKHPIGYFGTIVKMIM